MKSVHSGFLTKSPPESRMKGPFKSQWRRRFFVLYGKPQTHEAFPSTGHFDELTYYESEKMTKKKGSIDLHCCEELRDRLDSNYYRHLFSLRTYDHGNMRTYYLAADSEPEMDVWVDKLTEVMDLKNAPISTPTPVLMSPTAVHLVSPSGHVSASNTPQIHVISQRRTHVGNGHGLVSTAQPMSQLSVTTRNSLAVGSPSGPSLITASHSIRDKNLTFAASPLVSEPHSIREESLTLVSPNATFWDYHRPVFSPKLSNIGAESVHKEYNDDGDDDEGDDDYIYNFPRHDYQPERTSYLYNDSDTYDTPPLLRPPVTLSADETYDLLPPKLHGTKFKDYECDDDDDDDTYDVPSALSINVHPPPSAYGHTSQSHHSYVNSSSSVAVAATDTLSTSHSDESDPADFCEVIVSSRSRSFKSSRIQSKAPCSVEDDVKLPLTKHVYDDTDDTEDDDD